MVSTLNSLDGSIVANAAIIPAGTNGMVTGFTTNLSHLILSRRVVHVFADRAANRSTCTFSSKQEETNLLAAIGFSTQ